MFVIPYLLSEPCAILNSLLSRPLCVDMDYYLGTDWYLLATALSTAILLSSVLVSASYIVKNKSYGLQPRIIFRVTSLCRS